MIEAPVVSVEHGRLKGRVASSATEKPFYSFQGIPYAKPPLGSLRFKAPQPPEQWEGIRDATSEGNVSAQIDPFSTNQYIGDEDCLYLNVYTPSLDGAILPVMVFIHGGAFKIGSGNTKLYGADYLVERDVVVVTFNYRCGPLGFLCLNTPEVPGNAGIKDMVQAIRWVKANIHKFGGNPDNVTIFGESAGGAAVSLLTASPLTKNLISKAIIQSGMALSSWATQKEPVENSRMLAKQLGSESDDPQEIFEYLNGCSAKEIVEAHGKLSLTEQYPIGINHFVLVIEKEFPGVEAVITEAFIDLLTSGRVTDAPIMIGTNTLEFATNKMTDDLQVFIPEDLNIEKNSPEALAIVEKLQQLYFEGVDNSLAYFQLLSDYAFNIDTHRFVQYLVQATNNPIYHYKFDYVGKLNISLKFFNMLGIKQAMHMDELGYLFRNDYQKDIEPTPQDIKMRERLVRLWTNFAKTGNPTPDVNQYLNVTWLPVTKDNQYYLNLGSELTLLTSRDKEKMEFWDEVYSKHFRIWEHPKTNTDEVPINYTYTITESQPTEVNNVEKADNPKAPIVNEDRKTRPSNEVKVVSIVNGASKGVISANDPPEDDLPKDIGVNKFVNFYESLGDKK